MSDSLPAPLDVVLGNHKRSTAAVYLKRYLEASTADWRIPTEFSREGFSQWLANSTFARGAYGLEYVLEGFDQLVGSGRISQQDASLVVTSEFINVMCWCG